MFITFEGMDGCGKSSMISAIAKLLINDGYKVYITHEPGGTIVGEKLRHIILNNKMDPIVEALLYAASRKQHVIEKITPNLKKNIIVICDRYIDSSLAYQGIGRGIGIDKILKINSLNNDILWPTLTFLLNVSPDVAKSRIQKRKTTKKTDRFDNETMLFHNKIQKAFLKIAKTYKNRFIIIDANKKKSEIISKIFKTIKNNL
ncbi:MAG: dTMP kinase [Bacilli bacterium]|nr:dTMP kinase [Bacilli bacterium]